MQRICKWLFGLVCLVAAPTAAHDVGDYTPVVIDSDMGLDDVVTLAMALQSPQANIAAIVACEGVASREKGAEHLERMLWLFNRKEIPLYAAVKSKRAGRAPPFRPFAEEAVGRALPEKTAPFRRPFLPEAYVTGGEKTVILVLGPLTNLAAALMLKPEISQGIERVIVSGSPEANANWNMRYDPEALAAVKASGVRLTFVVPRPEGGQKPESWREGELAIGQATSIGEGLVKRLLADGLVRKHYLERLRSFQDELVFLYYADPLLFSECDDGNVFAPRNGHAIIHLLTRFISYGRQHKTRVILGERPLPDNVLQNDVRERRARLIANNGDEEWFAQLLVNELHQHLGPYSVIGAKMGLRAAELLNAPQHAMKVVSHTDAHPPFSCLNDGVIVSTGSTPGRGLFTHVPGPPGSVTVAFTYNGRGVTLTVRDEYRQKIKDEIRRLRERYTLENHEYWDEVRRLALDIWENWHRRGLF